MKRRKILAVFGKSAYIPGGLCESRFRDEQKRSAVPWGTWEQASLLRKGSERFWRKGLYVVASDSHKASPLVEGRPPWLESGECQNVKLLREDTGAECGIDEKGVVTVEPPLPPGCLSTVWGKDGYYFILGRTDDVINVAGHRLGTREIEEAVSSYPSIAEVAVVGVSDQIKGQVPLAFAVVKNPSLIETAEERKAMEKEKATVSKKWGKRDQTWAKRQYFGSLDGREPSFYT